MKEIRDDIKQIFSRLPPVPVSNESPLQLTDLGKNISSTLKGRDWAKRTASELVKQIQDKKPFEIQEFCFDYVQKEFKPTSDQDERIRACAYENGLKREQVLEVLVIELRDAILVLVNDNH